MRKLNEVGIVGMHDAGSFPEDLAIFQDMADTDDWTVRVYAMGECTQRNTFCPEAIQKVQRPDGRLAIRGVKLFAGMCSPPPVDNRSSSCEDGALGSWGSAMIEPYTDQPWNSGSLLINASTLTSLTKSWSAAGFQVSIHAIGDLANRYTIDAMAEALAHLCPEEDAAVCQAKHRFRIEHAQIIHPDDQLRLRKMNLIPSIQPTHATSDMKYAETRLGAARTAEEAYRMRSLLDLRPILGSDFPVEPPDPFQGIYAAVARRNPHTGLGSDGGSSGWHVEEALTLDEALLGFTTQAAYGAFMEGKAGIIKEGAMADWVVIEKPLDQMEIDELRNLKVRETWVAGRQVYKRD
jgi:predicted amidohydrolase YtcJ